MTTLTPVEGNPFEGGSGPLRVTVRPQDKSLKLTPVEGNPFESQTQGAAASAPSTLENIHQTVSDSGFGVGQGVTLGWGDELVAAGLTPIEMGIGAFTGSDEGKGLGERVSGSYDRAIGKVRGLNKEAQQRSPVAYGAGNVVGGAMIPLGAVGQAASLPARMATGAGIGGGVGAVTGAGEGEGLAGRATGALTGGALGLGIGAVAPPLVEGGIRAVQAVGAPIVRGVRGAFNPDTEAARRVGSAIARDVQADPNAVTRLTPQEFTANVQGGGPAVNMDLGGETTRALARSAANTSPEGRAALGRTINDRFEGQTDRVTGWLRNVFHYPNAQAQQQAIEDTARTVNRGAYARAYRDGSGGVWSPEIERLAGSDAVASAMQSAARKARDESIVGGYGAMNPRITFTPDGRIQFNRGPTGVPTYPDLQYWDLVRRELSDAAINAGRGTAEARRLSQFARALNAELDQLVPSYNAARQGAASFFQAENALEAGQNYVTQNFANTATRQALARMTPQERQLFQDGFVSRYIETLERVADRRSILNKIAETPGAREKLEIALGRQRAAELEAGLRVEGIMDMARTAIQGNSTTARQLAELGLAGGAGSIGAYGTYNLDPAQMTTAAVMGALLAGRRNIDHRVAQRVATLLTSNDPGAVTRGIQIVARNNRFLDNIRATDRRIAATGAQQSAPTEK